MTAIFPKDALGWIGAGARNRVGAGFDPSAVAFGGRSEETPVESGSDASPARWPEYAPELEGEAGRRLEPETAEATAAGLIDGPVPAPSPPHPCLADSEAFADRYCRMDTATTPEGLEFTIEVPGIRESDLEIRLAGDTIVVTGHQDVNRRDKTYRVIERECGPVLRSIKIAEGVPLHRIQASLDRGLLTIFVPNPAAPIGKTIAVNSAVRRISQGDDLYELKIDLPGADASEFDLAVRDGLLTISRRGAPWAAEAGDQIPNGFASRLLQSMEVPAGVDANQIRAVLAKGVLTVTLPIAAGHRQRTIPLEVASDPARWETATSGVEAEPPSHSVWRRQQETPTTHPFDLWIASDALAAVRGPKG